MRRIRRPTGGNGCVGRRSNRLLSESGLSGLLVGLAPYPLKVVITHVALLVYRSIIVGCVVGLRVNFNQGRRPGLVLVRGSSDLLSRATLDDAAVVPGSAITKVWSNS